MTSKELLHLQFTFTVCFFSSHFSQEALFSWGWLPEFVLCGTKGKFLSSRTPILHPLAFYWTLEYSKTFSFCPLRCCDHEIRCFPAGDLQKPRALRCTITPATGSFKLARLRYWQLDYHRKVTCKREIHDLISSCLNSTSGPLTERRYLFTVQFAFFTQVICYHCASVHHHRE